MMKNEYWNRKFDEKRSQEGEEVERLIGMKVCLACWQFGKLKIMPTTRSSDQTFTLQQV